MPKSAQYVTLSAQQTTYVNQVSATHPQQIRWVLHRFWTIARDPGARQKSLHGRRKKNAPATWKKLPEREFSKQILVAKLGRQRHRPATIEQVIKIDKIIFSERARLAFQLQKIEQIFVARTRQVATRLEEFAL